MTEPLLEVWHEGKTYAMTPRTLMDELTYSAYRYNRQRTPAIPPAQWRQAISTFTEAMEQRYQQEQGA